MEAKMTRFISLVLVLILLTLSSLALFSCSGEGGDGGSDIELTRGENGNWWVGGRDTGVSYAMSVTDSQARFITSGGIEYCVLTLTFSDGTTETVFVEVPKEEVFIPTATVTNGYGGASGIVCLMTDNDSGKFETVEILDELYAEYGLVGGLGTVVKNLYSDKEYTSPKYDTIARWQEYLDTGRWKIISHSMTHTTYCDFVDGERVVNEERLYSELVTSAEKLRELFPDQKVLTYAMTGTQSALGNNATSDPTNIRRYEKELIAEYYIGGRFKGTGATFFEDLKWNDLPHGLISRANLDYILSNIDKAATDGKYFMVYNHYVIDDALLDTVNESSWTNISTVKALCQRVSEYVEQGLIWNAHFEDAVLYMRERETASIMLEYKNGVISIVLTDEMDNAVYNHKLTLKVKVPDGFKTVKITQGDEVSYAEVKHDGKDAYVLANLLPDNGLATIEAVDSGEISEASSIGGLPIAADARTLRKKHEA